MEQLVNVSPKEVKEIMASPNQLAELKGCHQSFMFSRLGLHTEGNEQVLFLVSAVDNDCFDECTKGGTRTILQTVQQG